MVCLVLMSIEKGILCDLTGKGWIYQCFDGIVFLEHHWYIICIKIVWYCTIQIKWVSFLQNCRLQLQWVV